MLVIYAQNVVFSFVKVLGFIVPSGTERPDTVLGGEPCNWSIITGAQNLGTGLIYFVWMGGS